MEKLKFGFQVFTAVLALPLLSMMELNHTKKTLPIDNIGVEKRLTKDASISYFEHGSKISTVSPKKELTRRYCK